jgi:O-antigen/teichoic acid export membrane protein
MGIIKRQSLKTSLVNYLGVFLGVVFFNFVFPHLIGEEYLGLIGLFQYLTIVLSAIPGLGLAYGLLRYYSEWKDEEMIQRYHRFALLAMSLALFVFSILIFLFREPLLNQYRHRSALFVPYWYLIIPLIVIYTFTQYLELYSMVKLRVAVPAFIREILVRLLLIVLLYGFAYRWLNESELVYGLVGVYALCGLILLGYAVRVLDFKWAQSARYWNNSGAWRASLAYNGSMLLVLIASNLSNFIDGIILPAYLGLGALGIYMRPLVLGQMIQVPYRAISQISIPIIREALVDNDLAKVRHLNRQIGLNLFLIGTFLFAGLVACADGLFALLPPQYAQAKYVLYIIGFGRLIDMAFGLNSEILNYSNHYRVIIYLSILMMVMTIAFDVWFIPLWGMNGAALAVTLSLIVFNVLKSVFIYRRFGFHCFSKHYITLIVVMAAVIGVLHLVPFIAFIEHHRFYNALLNLLFKGSLSVLGFLIPIYFMKVSPDLNSFITLLVSGRLFRGGHKMEGL